MIELARVINIAIFSFMLGMIYMLLVEMWAEHKANKLRQKIRRELQCQEVG
ncbi:hypothetical protein ES705_25382 [subsurface metagenome]